jgi:hypothetical protein
MFGVPRVGLRLGDATASCRANFCTLPIGARLGFHDFVNLGWSNMTIGYI